jgi:hypothetical protein
MEPIVSDKNGARPADMPQAHEGTGTKARDGHLRPIPGADRGNRPPERAPAKAAMRRLMLETFMQCRPEIAAALRRRFTNPKTVLECLELLGKLEGELPKALEAIRRRLENPKYVQDVLELLARLQGEFAKESPDEARGISVIVIRGEGAISPEEFRRSADARMALEARR